MRNWKIVSAALALTLAPWAWALGPALPSALVFEKFDSADPVLPGVAFDYTLHVANPDSVTVTNVVVRDTLPPGLLLISASAGAVTQGLTNVVFTLASLGGGQTAVFTVRVQAVQSGLFTNQAALTDGVTQLSAEQTTYALSDLRVTMTDSVDPAWRGESFAYSFSVSNAGPVALTNVVAADTFPGPLLVVSAQAGAGSNVISGATVTFFLGALASGSTVTGAVVVEAVRAGTVTNRMTATGSSGSVTVSGLGEQRTTIRGSPSDLTADGLGDLVLEGSDGGALLLQAMNGRVASGVFSPLNMTNISPWQFAATTDVNGDGTADLIARSGGFHKVGYMTSGKVTRIRRLFSARADLSPWRVVAGGDYSGDGFGDLLFQRGESGVYAVVLQRSNRWTAVRYLTGTQRNLDPWRVVGAADTDGDGRSDLLLRSGSSGVYGVATMNGWAVRDAWHLTGSRKDMRPWEYRAGSDIDGDGFDELIFQKGSENVYEAAYVDGYRILKSGLLFTNGPAIAPGAVVGPR